MLLPPNALNYQHLLYFWVVAREGGVQRATRVLHLAQPTISGQIKVLERQLGERLFVRRGRHLALTDVGQVVYRYADDIFTLGQELREALAGLPGAGRPARFAVGISDSLPKLTTFRLLAPALEPAGRFRLVFRIGKTDALLSELAAHALDLVLTDAPPAASGGAAPAVRTFSHLLGESGASVFAAPPLAARLRRGFPASLDGAPWVLQTPNTALRRSLDAWFAEQGVRPAIAAEVEDVALLQVLGQEGLGVFAAPSVVEAEIRRAYGVRVIGRLERVRERFYAVSVERKLKHPAVVAISEAARRDLFG
jgi:LysR family transcriptional activator of nhaA